MRLFVCYIPGLDVRRISSEATPHIHALRAAYPTVGLSTLPSPELLPTMLTGVYPRKHGVWQVRLRPEFDWRRSRRLFERLPENLTTTLQGLRQMTDASFDLATVPPHRRSAFEQFRFKYTRRESTDETLIRFGDYDTLLGMLGKDAQYAFAKRFEKARALLDHLGMHGSASLLVLELYALDLFQHWHLDQLARMRWALRETDDFVARLEVMCRELGFTLVILVDHGQEPVVGTIPLRTALEQSGVPENEYSYFLEVAQCRFWFHTDGARAAITRLLSDVPHTTPLSYRELAAYHLEFDDDTWGETYLMADAGYIFFPHDFYRPLANLYLGLADSYQRPRVWNPRHRGNHGYLPRYPSERGFMTLIDERYEIRREEGELTDVAPTVLDLLNHRQPNHMLGAPLFGRRARAGSPS